MDGVGILVTVYHIGDWVVLGYPDGRFSQMLTPEQGWNALETILELVQKAT